LHALLVGEFDHAGDAFCKQLNRCRALAFPQHAGWALAGLAAIAAYREQDERAALLLGAAKAREAVEHPDVMAQLDDRFFVPARARLGEGRWDQAGTAGAQLTFEQAVDFALSPRAALSGSAEAGTGRA
jgi:hypothetical protein